MIDLYFNRGQLSKGQVVVQNINNSIDSFEKDLDSAINEIKNAAKAYKVNLDNTIVVSGLQEDFKNLRSDLSTMNDLSERQSSLVEKYEKGDLYLTAIQFHQDADQYLKDELFRNSNFVNPDALTRVGATVGMGVFKFGEGFLEFFEDVGDCAITIGAGVASVLGAKDVSKSWKEFAKRDLAIELVENNDAFRWVNKNSYFDKDSAFATAFKIGGKATAALVTGKVASNIYMSRVSDASKVLNNVPSASKVTKRATEISNLVSTQGANVTSNLKSGQGLKNALLFGTVASGVSLGLTKGVSNPLGEKVGEKISESSVGEIIRNVDGKAAEVFNEETKDTIERVSKSVIDTSVKTGKKETTGNLISGDGNETSVQDEEAKYAANAGIDTIKKSAETTVEKSLEQAAENSLENVIEGSIEKTVMNTVL